MKILHIDPDDMDNPLSGGGPVRTYEIYRRMASRHEITVLTPTFTGSTPETIRDGIRYVRLGKKIGYHGSSHHITFFASLPGALRHFNYDLLVEDFMPPMSATFNPLFNSKPMIASVQWFFAEALSRQYKLPFFLGERFGLRLYDNFIVLTTAMRRKLEKRHGKARFRVIANGVDDAHFTHDPEFGDFILYLGRVDFQQKGVDLLLKAYSRIPQKKRLKLVLAGHGFDWGRIKALVRQLDLEKWVDIRGKVNFEEKLKLLTACRFTCIPSREETFGMVILESCASGKPVVFFDRSPMNEVAAPECTGVRPYDIEKYGAAIASLIDETESEMILRSQGCARWAERFRWDDIAARQEQFYREVASGKPVPNI